MKFKVLPTERPFTGPEMAQHWAYKNFGLCGDSIVAFRGRFEVPPESWTDLDAVVHGKDFFFADMLNFIVEHFDSGIREAVMRQYILVSILEEKMLHRMECAECRLVRLGDDLFDADNRLSITACSITPVSTKLYLGVYLDPSPKNGIQGLKFYNLKALDLAELVINQYRAEMRRLEEKSWRTKPIF